MNSAYTSKQKMFQNKGKKCRQAGNDSCVVTPYVLLPLMACQLSRFEIYFYKLTSVFTAAAFVTVEECNVSSRK